jgi:hypothetical protein
MARADPRRRVVTLGKRQRPEERRRSPSGTAAVERHRDKVGRALQAGRRERLLNGNMDDNLLPRLVEAERERLARVIEHE